jgi:hypothetical protein
MVRWKWDLIPVVLGSSLLGLLFKVVLSQALPAHG